MGLLERLRGTDPDQPRVNAHGFQAAMSEWADGAPDFSRASIIAQFSLTLDDEVDLDTLKAIWNTANTDARRARLSKVFDNVVLIAGDRDLSFYSTNASIVARLTEAAS